MNKIGIYDNLNKNFERDSGIKPSHILDQPTRNELISFLIEFPEQADKLILHFISHGNIEGFGKELLNTEDGCLIGDKETLIEWSIFVELLNIVSVKCKHLIVNLGSVCNSVNIENVNINRNFDMLVTTSEIGDLVEPRKKNKVLINNMDNMGVHCPGDIYKLLRKQSLKI